MRGWLRFPAEFHVPRGAREPLSIVKIDGAPRLHVAAPLSIEPERGTQRMTLCGIVGTVESVLTGTATSWGVCVDCSDLTLWGRLLSVRPAA